MRRFFSSRATNNSLSLNGGCAPRTVREIDNTRYVSKPRDALSCLQMREGRVCRRCTHCAVCGRVAIVVCVCVSIYECAGLHIFARMQLQNPFICVLIKKKRLKRVPTKFVSCINIVHQYFTPVSHEIIEI